MSISVDIEKSFGDFTLKLAFEAGDKTLALLGESGCGKSMTLKCIAGIVRPDRGRIVVDGVTLFDSENRINLTPQRRRMGLLFQNYALFPNMTVLENIRAGARRETDRAKRERSVRDMINSFGIGELAGRYPHQLSGGQQQRAALARILVSDPLALLLDEPFSALDSHLRFRLERDVREVIRRFGKTVLLVSHDRDEVFRMADSIAVMRAGGIEVCGARSEVFADPQTRTGAVLTGCKNVSRLNRCGENRAFAEDWGMELVLPDGAREAEYVGIRMHDICPGPGENSFRCRVVEEIENPFSFTVMMLAPGGGNVPIGWETEKHIWREHRAPELEINLPKESLLMLRG